MHIVLHQGSDFCNRETRERKRSLEALKLCLTSHNPLYHIQRLKQHVIFKIVCAFSVFTLVLTCLNLVTSEQRPSICERLLKNRKADEHVLQETQHKSYSLLWHFLLKNEHWGQTDANLQILNHLCVTTAIYCSGLIIEQLIKCRWVSGKREDKLSQQSTRWASNICTLTENKTHTHRHTHRHIKQYFHRVHWLCSDWPGLYGVYTLHVFTEGAEAETDHKLAALVCDSKSMVELAAYPWPRCWGGI